MNSITLQGISKKYGDVVILNNINLVINENDYLVVVGPSGCGKTTLLRIIAGLEEPSEGILKINDKPASSKPQERKVSMVFQSSVMYPHLNVYDNIVFAIKNREGSYNSQLVSDVQSVANLFKIDHLLNKMPNQISGGERQRVNLAKAIISRPEIILFDEPLSSLDPILRKEIRDILKTYFSNKVHSNPYNLKSTFIVHVTHDQLEGQELATKIAVMNSGKLEQVGSYENLIEAPQTLFIAQFINYYSLINEITGRIRNILGNFYICVGASFYIKILQNPKIVIEEEFIFTIRPEETYFDMSLLPMPDFSEATFIGMEYRGEKKFSCIEIEGFIIYGLSEKVNFTNLRSNEKVFIRVSLRGRVNSFNRNNNKIEFQCETM